jgi:hypothetical protein
LYAMRSKFDVPGPRRCIRFSKGRFRE